MKISFTLNSQNVSLETRPDKKLIDILRDDFGLTATKKGCQAGECGSCLALFNGTLVNTCLIPAFRVHGARVLTVEGFSSTKEYSLIESAFHDSGVHLCGFCSSGIIMATEALLSDIKDPGEEDIRNGLSGNFCHCISYNTLVKGVEAAARKRRKKRYGRRR